MEYINLVTKKIVKEKETEFCIPLHNFKQMLEYQPTVEEFKDLEF